MHGSKDFRIWRGGRTWSGWWELDGREVLVCSAWGSKRGPRGRRDPQRVAEQLLGEILDAWRPPA